MEAMNEYGILVEILLSVFLGAVVGFERELAGKAAGLRTHMLVAGSSTFLVAIGDTLLISYQERGLSDMLGGDPFRLISAIITGLSFIGAGTIIQNKRDDRVEGLTTAASLLFMGTIGIGIALQKYILSAGATILILLINRGMFYIENLIRGFRDRNLNK